MKYAHMCVHLYVHTADWQTNKYIFDAMEIYPNETFARRQAEIATPEHKDWVWEREREGNQTRQTVTALSAAPSQPLCIQLQSHAVPAPLLVVDATIRVVNNVTVFIPQWSLTRGTAAQCKTNQFLINNNSYYIEWKGGWSWVRVLSICFYNSVSIDVKQNDRFIETVQIEFEIVSIAQVSRSIPYLP